MTCQWNGKQEGQDAKFINMRGAEDGAARTGYTLNTFALT